MPVQTTPAGGCDRRPSEPHAAAAHVADHVDHLPRTIDAGDPEFVTIKLQSGNLVRIPRSGVAAGNGDVVIGLTAEELEAQSAPSASTASSQ